MDDLEFKPIGEVLPGVNVKELDPGYTPLEAVVMVKALDEEGDVTWLTRYTEGPHSVEFLGALTAGVAILTGQVREGYIPDEDA